MDPDNQLAVPPFIASADKLVRDHSDLREMTVGLYVWSLRIGERTFIRYREPLTTRSTKGRERAVWCRIDNHKQSKTSKPSPLLFENALRKALGKSKKDTFLINIFS